MQGLTYLFLVGAIPPAAALFHERFQERLRPAGGGLTAQQLQDYTFAEFVERFNRTYAPGTEEWVKRWQLFKAKKEEVIQFQSGPPQSWTKGITKFADYTDAEFKAMLGYKGMRRSTSSSAKFAQGQKFTHPPAFNTRSDSRILGELVRDQGSCGSCWAEAATATLEGQMESNDTLIKHMRSTLDSLGKMTQAATLSSQTMVSCTLNPRNCGGTGGCEGATVELAYDMVKEHGIPLAVEWPYESGFGGTPACDKAVFEKAQLAIAGYEVLPSNKLHPLMQALYESGGPVAVSVDATHWSMYSGGIFSDNLAYGGGDFTVNHAVTLMAYQSPHENKKGYWLIKNSWGVTWGENGFIRLEMKENEEEHCGLDRDTHKGLACDGDPDTAWVCGTCGVLYDSVYPTGLHIKGA